MSEKFIDKAIEIQQIAQKAAPPAESTTRDPSALEATPPQSPAAAALQLQPLETGESYILRLLGRIAELERQVYVPGLWRCAKCKLQMFSQTIYVQLAALGPNNKPQDCPNGCGPMWRISEREAGNELADRMSSTRDHTLEQVAQLVTGMASEAKGKKPFLVQVADDVAAANDPDLRPHTVQHFAEVLVARIRGMKTPA